MSERAWYRSLYWRIALGFILFLGTMLVVQAGLFLWMAIGSSSAGLAPEAMDDLSRVIAADLGETLTRDDSTDVEGHLRERYGEVAALVVVVFPDGRVASATGAEPPGPLVRLARTRLRRLRPARMRRRPPPGRGPRGIGLTPVFVRDRPAAMVLVARDRPWSAVVRELGPLMLVVAGLLAASGTGLAALLIFRPAHRRLHALETATARLGAGDLGARAPTSGGDEIANVAAAFNRMATDLERREGELRASDRTRRQLLADVSHELMTPLTAIRGYLETLQMPGLDIDPPTRERYLGIMTDEAQRLERLIGDLLELSRFEAGGISLAIDEASVAELFARVTARHEPTARERGVTLASTIADGLDRVRADPDRLEQALQNLAANALRHTPRGGRVMLEADRDLDTTRLAVRDTGAGISPEHLPHVFDRFFKADESRQGTAGGSGLGLSIVKAIVELHGGAIRVRSVPGSDTVFEIRLPNGPVSPAPDLAPTGVIG